MSNILLPGVTGFTGITFSLVRFWTYSSKLPLRAKRRESWQGLGWILVLGLPMSSPNTTKQKNPPAYPLSTPVKGVDGNFDFSPADLGFHRRGAPERRNPTKT